MYDQTRGPWIPLLWGRRGGLCLIIFIAHRSCFFFLCLFFSFSLCSITICISIFLFAFSGKITKNLAYAKLYLRLGHGIRQKLFLIDCLRTSLLPTLPSPKPCALCFIKSWNLFTKSKWIFNYSSDYLLSQSLLERASKFFLFLF